VVLPKCILVMQFKSVVWSYALNRVWADRQIEQYLYLFSHGSLIF